MKVSAMNRKYIASSENNSYESNNREIITFYSTIIQLDNAVTIHIWFNKHRTWHYCKQFTSDSTTVEVDNSVNNYYFIFTSNEIYVQSKWQKLYFMKY